MAELKLHGAALQFPVSMDVAANVSILERLLRDLPDSTVAVTPEGALSGYLPEKDFVAKLNPKHTAEAMAYVSSLAVSRAMHIVSGACLQIDETWRNSSFVFCPDGTQHRYDKVNLARSERGTFQPGDSLPVFELKVLGKSVQLGIQMCREIRYPEQWRVLAERGAQIFAYPNNAIGSESGDWLWRAHLKSRAAETQRFIIGANNSARDQTCPTMILDPNGRVLSEVTGHQEGTATANLPLQLVSNWILDQARRDVVRVEIADILNRSN